MTLVVKFVPSGRGKAQCPPNPNFPKGMALDFAGVNKGCVTAIPYPSPECGAQIITCAECGLKAVITVAGRIDDAHTVIVPCKPISSEDIKCK